MKISITKTSVTCPNCGLVTWASECPWCHYPLAGKQAIGEEAVTQKTGGGARKLIDHIVTSLLVLVIAILAFLQFSPDYGIYIVKSGSMSPAIKTGDIIITGPAGGFLNGEIKPGTVITFRVEKDLVTHRVQSIEGDRIITRGDSLEEADPWQVSISDVQGIYLFKIPYLGYLPYFARTRLGWFLLILLPSAVLVGLLVKDIIKEALKP